MIPRLLSYLPRLTRQRTELPSREFLEHTLGLDDLAHNPGLLLGHALLRPDEVAKHPSHLHHPLLQSADEHRLCPPGNRTT